MSVEVSVKSRVVSAGADQPYWDGLEAGRVLMQRCPQCGRWHWPAVFRCGGCGSWAQSWTPVEPVGTIYAFTRTWHPFAGLEALTPPFVSLVVAIDGAGGRRLTGLLEGPTEGLQVGARAMGRIAEAVVFARSLPALRFALLPAFGA